MSLFTLNLSWKNDQLTGELLADFSRDAQATAEGKHPIEVSSAASYQGNATRWNPEDMLGASLGMCHMLTFLALAHKNKMRLLSYDDHIEVTLDRIDGFTQVTQIKLSPTIRVASDTNLEVAKTLFEKAHKYCFIARSINSKVILAPTFTTHPENEIRE